MSALRLSDIIDHWTVGRTRALLEPRASGLRQMSHLPPHLIDDVNALGFPPDRRYQPPVNQSRSGDRRLSGWAHRCAHPIWQSQ